MAAVSRVHATGKGSACLYLQLAHVPTSCLATPLKDTHEVSRFGQGSLLALREAAMVSPEVCGAGVRQTSSARAHSRTLHSQRLSHVTAFRFPASWLARALTRSTQLPQARKCVFPLTCGFCWPARLKHLHQLVAAMHSECTHSAHMAAIHSQCMELL